ncbi:unnamed protein product [Dicrocoelium dendriticum]|nr:unnamed protein product [Dicrocoelium dendriticum]
MSGHVRNAQLEVSIVWQFRSIKVSVSSNGQLDKIRDSFETKHLEAYFCITLCTGHSTAALTKFWLHNPQAWQPGLVDMIDRTLNQEAIAAHNRYRAAHGSPNLVYDESLARSAQRWAQEIAKRNRLQHSEARNCGENLGFKWCSAECSLSGDQVTKMWYDEIKDHDYNKEFQPKSGHFTQVIWKGTTKAGFGSARSSDGKSIYVVGHYLPAGNVVGQFKENVPRPIKSIEPCSSGDATANIADGRIRRRIEPIYPADDSQPPAAFPPSSTIHATIVPLRVSDRFPVNGRTSLDGSNVVISFLTRVRDFFLDIFGSSIHLTAGKSDTREYNLSAIDLCPRHLSAIGALLSYGLLSHPDTTSSPDLMITLSERQLRGLRSLDQCFHLLDQKTHVFNSDHLNPQLAVHHRVLVLPKNADDPVMANCNAATQLLNMVFAPNNDSSSHRNSQETAKYNILQLFLAYQYRIQLHRTLSNASYHRAPISPTEHVLYPWWISGGGRELVPHIQSTCPKLPDFLSHLMHLPTVDPPVSPTPGSTRCSNTSSTIVPREPVASHQRSSNTVMREQIVVPAALAGSRKDTALMRLTNRVRLLERNVSVSMRYLEELSQSYKRQMERLSRSFNLTTAWLKATAQGAEERDQAQQTRISVLEQRLDELLSQFRSASIEFQDSNSSATSDSKRERDLTLELEEVSAPPALNFDAPPDWNPGASVWPPLSDDWLEDGVVETEDDDPIESHQHPSDSDRFRHIRPYRAESVLPASDWSPRDCEPQVASDWKSAVQRWFIERFDSLLKFTNLSWQLLPTSSPNVFWILYMTLLHLTFAAASHALVYLTWLRPQGRKLSCTFDSLSFVHQTPLAWTCSPHHLTLSGPSSYRVPNTNCLQAHNVTVLPSNGDYGLGLSTLPENHTTEHPKFRPLAAASLTNSGSNSVDTIGSSIPVGSDTHQLPDLGSLQKEPLHSALPLNNDVQVPHPAANRCSDCSETYIPRVPVPNEPLQIRVDDSSSSTPSSKCVASLDQPSPPVLSKRARKRHNKRARANWNAQ